MVRVARCTSRRKNARLRTSAAVAAVNSAPIITVDWKDEEGSRCKVPFGLGGGKLMTWGKLPVNLQTQAYYFVEKPDFGPDWQLRVQVQLLFPLPGS